ASQLITSGVSKTTLTTMDGMGHVIQTKLTTDPEGADSTEITYDGMGRVYTRSNPHRSSASTTDGTTTYTYDPLGRTTKVLEPDGSIVATSYSGNQATVTDEVGNQRTTLTDGLGVLTDVSEALGVTGFNFASHYLY